MTYCKPCHNSKGRESRERHGGARGYHLKRRYGIGLAEYDAMSEAQDGFCAICHESPASQVDHDHLTKKVRGLLCFNCNGALGQFRDRPELMVSAVLYLFPDSFGAMAAEPGVQFGVHAYIGPEHVPPPFD